jgi:two-component system CheB/CheR fusion protein
MRESRPDFIVGIGGSAGSLNAFKALLDALPSNTGAAYVIVSHILPEATSQLAEILSKHTKMKVLVTASAMRIRANRVYVCPPNTDLRIEGEAFKVVSPRTRGNVVIDFLFSSLAEAKGTRAIGIILSGNLDDGTAGCKAIRAKGGITFAQDKSAEFGGMSRNAQTAGHIDFVLSPKKIAAKLGKVLQVMT